MNSPPKITEVSGPEPPPIFAWELSLGVWLVDKGFKPSPITTGMTAAGNPPTTTSPSNRPKHGRVHFSRRCAATRSNSLQSRPAVEPLPLPRAEGDHQ